MSGSGNYPDSLGPGRVRLLTVDFGPTTKTAPGMKGIGSRTRDPVCGWSHGMVREIAVVVAEALRRHLWGDAGLLASTVHGYWWEPPGVWSASKTGWLLEILAWARQDRPGEAMERWILLAQRWLSDPLLRQRVGATSLSFMPNGEFSLVATGFTGVGVAASIDFDALFPVCVGSGTDSIQSR